MKHKHFLITALFIFFSCTLAAAQTRRIEAKKKPQDAFAADYVVNKPQVVFNVGHSGIMESICYSLDGKYIASGSSDRTVKIWKLETGRELRTLRGHSDRVNSVCYSPDGKAVASGSRDDTIKLWDVASGECIKTLTEHKGSVESIVYNSDGKYLASGSFDHTIKLWDVASGNCIKTLEGHTNSVVAISYSPDEKYLVSCSWDDTIKIWDVANGKCIKTLIGHTSSIKSVAYSPDGKHIASSYEDGVIKIWDVTSGNCIKTLTGHERWVNSVAYSPDGKYIASGSNDNTVKLWDAESGSCINTLDASSIVASVVYGLDGIYLASGSWNGAIKIWNVSSGECIKTCGGQVNSVRTVVFSPDGKIFANNSYGNTIKFSDLESSKSIKTLEGHWCSVHSIMYSPDGRYLASGYLDDRIRLWDVISGECIKILEGHIDSIESVCYSPDGKYIASGSEDKTIKLWEAATGECVKTFEGHTDTVYSVAYSPDGKYVASGSKDETINIWEVASGKCIKTLIGHTSYVRSIAYSPNGKYIASSSLDSTIKIWKVVTGECVKTLEGHTGPVESIAYSPDGRYLASGSWDETIKIWNVVTEQCINTLTGHTGWVRSVCYSPDGAYLASGSNDDTIRFWDASTGNLLATTFNLKNGEWLTYTPEGFFAGSEWATKNLVHIVDGMKTVGIDQLYDSLYRPDLVSAKLSGEDISPYAQKVNFASLVQTGSAPVVTFLSLDDEVKERDVAIEFAIQNTGGGIGEVNLLLNGKNIRLAENVASKSGETVHFSHTITLQNGKNTVELYAKNEAGKVESLHVSKTLNWQGTVKKPNLYIFTVAINKYRDRRLQLKYAVPDAEFILKGFSSQKKSLYQNIFTHHLFDDNVTKDGVKSSFEKLGNEVQADDVFVFYIAGHGITYDEDGDYYYLPSNFRFTSSEAIQQQGISKNDLTRYLSLIKAGKTLMLMDTCNAGSFLGNNTRGLSEQTAIDRLTRSTGHATIVASSDDQVAMEGYEGHGIFTYILVEGLRGKADTDRDGFITLQELSAYTEEEVPRRSYEKWGYEQTPMRNLRRQDFPIYTSGNR